MMSWSKVQLFHIGDTDGNSDNTCDTDLAVSKWRTSRSTTSPSQSPSSQSLPSRIHGIIDREVTGAYEQHSALESWVSTSIQNLTPSTHGLTSDDENGCTTPPAAATPETAIERGRVSQYSPVGVRPEVYVGRIIDILIAENA